MKGILVLLLLLVLVLGLVRVTSSDECTNGSISTVKIQEWEGGAVGPIQVCVDNQLATPCLGGWNLRSSLVVCRELGLPTKDIGYYVESCQEIRPLYYAFICYSNQTSLINCRHWKFLDCSCGIGIFCGNLSSGQNSSLTTSPCAACEDSNMSTYSEHNTPAYDLDHTYTVTPIGEIGSSGAANETTTLAGSCDISTKNPLIIGVLGGLCVILGMALVCVVFRWSVTSWKLHKMSVSRCHREEEVSTNFKFTHRETNTSHSLPDLNSCPPTSGNKALSDAICHEPSQTESLVVEEDSVLVVAGGGEGRENQGKGEGMRMNINEVFYHSLEKPQEYEEFYPVEGKNEDKGKVNEVIYNNAKELEIHFPHKSNGKEALSNLVGNEFDSHEDAMYFMSGETGGGLGKGHRREGHLDGLEKPHEYEEFGNDVGNNEDKDQVINEVIYNYVEKKELKMSTLSGSSTSDTLSNLVGDEVNRYENAMYCLSKETGVGEQAGQGVGEQAGQGVGEQAGQGVEGGGKTEKCEVFYHNLGKPQEYEEFYKVLGNDVDEVTEAVYDVVKKERLEMYSLLNHS